MKIKTISYRRHINLGNYENKAAEVVGELEDGDDPDAEFQRLGEFVERNLRLDQSEAIQSELIEARRQLRELKKQIKEAEKHLQQPPAGEPTSSTTEATVEEVDEDDIPFDQQNLTAAVDLSVDSF
ncbi:MAG TPA: hypothetical protein VK203_27490 [Nostocaceae cyanobacterium]|nr:hypothetical protein [Nostocaceae cyanobacterium]